MGRARPKYMGWADRPIYMGWADGPAHAAICSRTWNIHVMDAIKKQKGTPAGRRAVGSRELPDAAELPNWSGGRWCCWGSEGGRGGIFFFFLLPCFFLSSVFSLLSLFLSSSLSFSRLVSPSQSLFFFLVLPCFYRQKTGETLWWGGHCWPPPPLPFQWITTPGKWVSMVGVFLHKKRERK